MKSLKFSDPLINLILEGKKTKTWRINDDKDLKEGDLISLRNNKNEEFKKARILAIKEKRFKELNDEDKKGQEGFKSDEDMYDTYSKYYGIKVKPETRLKIIQF